MQCFLEHIPNAIANHPHRDRMLRIVKSALAAVEPKAAVKRFIKREGDVLFVDQSQYLLGGFEHVYLIAIGKASISMSHGVVDILGDRLTAGLIVTKALPEKPNERLSGFDIIRGHHPTPDETSLAAGQRVLNFLSKVSAKDLVVFAISGGGSSLITQPANDISLDDLQVATNQLLASGADIKEINNFRKHVDLIKGGGLARTAFPAAVVSLILSDVIGSPLDVIASGPTVPDPGTFRETLEMLSKYKLNQVPEKITSYLRKGLKGEVPETAKPGDPIFARVQNVLVGSNLQAAQAAMDDAQKNGYRARVITTEMQGEAVLAGKFLAHLAKRMSSMDDRGQFPLCLVAGGETTVTLHGNGLGGRNQEVALAAVEDLSGLPGCVLITFATDGEDGPTPSAGAVVTGETAQRAHNLGLSPQEFIDRNASYEFFDKLEDVLVTGPTGTNVNDLAFLFLDNNPYT